MEANAAAHNDKTVKWLVFLCACSSVDTGVAASLGFEPRQRDSESLVLPLHYEATSDQNRDRCASLQVAQLPSRINLRGGDLLCLEQNFGALLSAGDF